MVKRKKGSKTDLVMSFTTIGVRPEGKVDHRVRGEIRTDARRQTGKSPSEGKRIASNFCWSIGVCSSSIVRRKCAFCPYENDTRQGREMFLGLTGERAAVLIGPGSVENSL